MGRGKGISKRKKIPIRKKNQNHKKKNGSRRIKKKEEFSSFFLSLLCFSLFLTTKKNPEFFFKKSKSKMDVAPEAWHLATAFKNMQLWRKEAHKHSQEEWATNFITYYFQNICWCEVLANNTKKKNAWFFTTHTFFCEQHIPRLKLLQIFLTKDEVQSSEEEEENISCLLHFFPSSSCS